METLNTNTPETKETNEHHLKFQQAVESMVTPVDRETEWITDGYGFKVVAEAEFDIPLGSVPLVPANKAKFRVLDSYDNPASYYGEDAGVPNSIVVWAKEYEVTLFDSEDGPDVEPMVKIHLQSFDKSCVPADRDPDILVFAQGDTSACDNEKKAHGDIIVPGDFFIDSLSKVIEATQK